MKKFITAFIAAAALPLAAVDFDFTTDPPAAKGQVPMLKLDSLKIGGTQERTALHFDGTVKPPVFIPSSAGLTLDKGITIAMELFVEKKAEKNWHMLILKKNEYLVLCSNGKIEFMWKTDNTWHRIYSKKVDLDKPHKFIITLNKERRFDFYLDGEHVRVIKTAQSKVPAPNPAGKELIRLGAGWNNWDFKGDIYQLKIQNTVWNKEQIGEFFK